MKMQLFNGITMGVFDFYRARYENGPEAPEDLGDKSKDQGKLREEVLQLTDEKNGALDDSNDNVEGLENFLNLNVADYFSKHIDAANKLIKVIDEYKKGKDQNGIAQGVEQVYKFLKSIVEHKDFTLNKVEVQAIQSGVELDDLLENKIGECKIKIDELLKTPNISGSFKNTLNNINNVLENPKNDNYVKQLQKYIYESVYANLSSQEKSDFEKSQKAGEDDNTDWSGKINDQLLKGVDIILTRIQNSLQPKEKSDGGVGGAGTVLDASIKPSEGPVTELPGGYKKVEGILVNGVVLYESTSAGTSGGNVDADNGGQVLDKGLVENAVKDLKGLGLGENSEVSETVYLMKVGKETYAVRLDGDKCLYPIAVDVNRGQRVFLKNNPSCMQYLMNKVDERVADPDIKIGWNGRNYTIGKGDYNKWLEILPMTIAGDWISKDLSECLAFLNFTNYLRNEPGFDREGDGEMEGKFKNDNPNVKWENDELYVKVKKMDKADYNKGEDLSRTWMHVDLNDFGLDRDSNVMKKFKKYNNREQWEDINHFYNNENNQYHSVDLQGMIAREQKVAQRRVAQQRARKNPSVNPTEGVSSRSVDVKTQLDNGLTAVDENFNKADYGIISDETVYSSVVGSETFYYYQDGGSIVKISESQPWMKQTVNGTIDSSNLSNVPDFLQSSKEVNLCDLGVDMLCSKLSEAYGDIKGDPGAIPDGISIFKEQSGYFLKKENESRVLWSFPLDNAFFTGGDDGRYIGIREIGDRLKIALFACDYHDAIKHEEQISIDRQKAKKYGITDDNINQVKVWCSNQIVKEDATPALITLTDN